MVAGHPSGASLRRRWLAFRALIPGVAARFGRGIAAVPRHAFTTAGER